MGAFDAFRPAGAQQPPNAFDALNPRATSARDSIGGLEMALSGAEYAGAGKLQELLTGQPVPMEARTEYGDVLREIGFPEPVAAGLGFGAAAIADPINLVPLAPLARLTTGVVQGALKLGKGGKLFRAMEKIAAKAGELPESIHAIAASVPDLGSARARTASRAEGAAKAAFESTMGTQTRETAPELFKEATKSARSAAAEIRRTLPDELAEGSDPLLMGELYNKLLRKFGDKPAVHEADRLAKQFGSAWSWYVRNLADDMRTNKLAWGEKGGEMAAKLEYTEQLTALSEGQMQPYISGLLRGLSRAERINASEVMEGVAKPVSQQVADAVVKWKVLRDQIFDDARKAGIKQKVPPTHSLGQQELFGEYVKQARQLAKLVPQKKWPEVPIQYRGDGLYKMRSERVVRALQTEGSPARKEAIAKMREAFPEALGSNKAAAEKLDELIGDAWDPIDIRGGPLQHTRNDILDLLGVPWEKDPAVWMRKYAHIASKRVAQAITFGPDDEAWKRFVYGVHNPETKELVQAGLQQEGGDVDRAEKAFRAFIGRPQQGQAVGQRLFTFIRQLQTLRLGPRVGVLQFLQLANPAALYGIANTGRAFGALARNPKLAQAAEVVGALLPSRHLAYDASELDNFSSWWMNHVSLMPHTDRVVRATSSLAAGYRVSEIAEELAKATGGKRRILERELASLGVDAAQLAEQGFQPTLRQVQVAMQRGAKVTQFTTDVTDLPAAARSGTFARIAFIFRSFAKQQSTFANRLIREARKGNVKPLARYLSTFPGIYGLAEMPLQILQGREYEPAAEEDLTDYLKTLMFVGMLGSFGDYLNSAGDSERLAKQQLGPAVGGALDVGAAVPTAAGGDFEQLQKALLRNIAPGGSGTAIINLTE